MDWIFNTGKSAQTLKAWRFRQPSGFAIVLFVIAYAMHLIQKGVFSMPRAAPASNQLTGLDWFSLISVAVGLVISLYAVNQAYQDFVHEKWREDAYRYRNGDYY